jgi:hypothetical protein
LEKIKVLIEKIDSYLETRPTEMEREKHCFHPSSLHRHPKVLKQLYFSGDDAARFEGRVYRIFDNGHFVHSRLQAYLEKTGVLLEAEVSIEDKELEIVGRCDGIIQLGDKEGVLEIKSINTRGFDNLKKPKREHIGQLNVYMHCVKLPYGVLLYENKNDQRLKEFYIRQDSAVLDYLIKKIRYTQFCIREGVEPVEDWELEIEKSIITIE